MTMDYWNTQKLILQNHQPPMHNNWLSGRKIQLKPEGLSWVVSSLHGKQTAYAMWKTLRGLFERRSDAKKLTLKDKLMNIRM